MEVEQQYGDQVRFIGIPGLDDIGSMRDFVASTGTEGLIHIPDEEGVIWERFGVSEQLSLIHI